MAKSLRSKWRRKMRAVKRERYGKKELDRLKKTLGIDDETQTSSEVNKQDISDIVTFTTAKEIRQKNTDSDEVMDIIGDAEVENIKKFNPKTLRNDKGAYPIWLHPRKVKKATKKTKKIKKSSNTKPAKSKGKVTKNKKK